MKKLTQKGALFVEYALLLAFVLITGVAFVNRNEFPDSVKSIFVKAEQILGLAAGEGPGENQGGNTGGNSSGEGQGDNGGGTNSNTSDYSFEGCRQGLYWGDQNEGLEASKNNGFSTANLVPLGQGEYEIVFDRKEFSKAVNNAAHSYNEIHPYLMGYTLSGETVTHVLDSKNSAKISDSNKALYTLTGGSESNGVYTFTLKNSGETLNLGVNFSESNWGTKESNDALAKAINQSLTITKKQ